VTSTAAGAAVALYEKHRPNRFADVIGQDEAVTALRTAVISGQPRASYLLWGKQGTGKTTLARILSRALNCPNARLLDGEACMSCPSCDGATGFDIIEIDAASEGGVDNVRKLIQKLQNMPAGRYKIVIIDECHAYSEQAWYAFLKTVENPGGKVVLLFCTTEYSKVIGTIRSRVTELPLAPVADDLLVDHLGKICAEEGMNVSAEVITEAVRRGNGSVRDAITALDSIVMRGEVIKPDPALGLVDALITGTRLAVLTALHNARAVSPATLAEQTSLHLSAIYVTLLNAPDKALLPDRDGRRQQRADAFDEVRCTAAMEAVAAVLGAIRANGDGMAYLQVYLCQYALRCEQYAAQKTAGATA
jgi:DNA polymerase III subunit gamma/tau